MITAHLADELTPHQLAAIRAVYGPAAALDIPANTPPAHGTCTTYNAGCRCEPCRAANTARKRQERGQRVSQIPLVHGRPVIPGEQVHGDPSAYRNRGCRCEPCTAAQAVYFRELRRRHRIFRRTA